MCRLGFWYSWLWLWLWLRFWNLFLAEINSFFFDCSYCSCHIISRRLCFLTFCCRIVALHRCAPQSIDLFNITSATLEQLLLQRHSCSPACRRRIAFPRCTFWHNEIFLIPVVNCAVRKFDPHLRVIPICSRSQNDDTFLNSIFRVDVDLIANLPLDLAGRLAQ